MNYKEKGSPDVIPLGLNFSLLAKKYVGIINKRLNKLSIDRYYYIIALIDASDEPITQQDLANRFSIDKAAVVGIVAYLSNHNYIKRTVNPKDRRQYILKLTPKGKKVVPEIYKVYKEVNQIALEGIEQKDVDKFYYMLEKICENFSHIPSENFFLKFTKTKSKK